MLAFLEFHVIDEALNSDRLESTQYQIVEITNREFKIILEFFEDHPVAQFDYYGNNDNIITIYVKKFKTIDEYELNIYQRIFDFSENAFNSFNESLITYFLSDIVGQKNDYLVSKIFRYYLLKNSQFVDDLKWGYMNISRDLFDNEKWHESEFLLEYSIFLESWLDYINYLEAEKETIDLNGWDSNLNRIIDQYLNVNPYCSDDLHSNTIYIFNNNWLNLDQRTISEWEKINVEENGCYDNIIKYLKKNNIEISYYTIIEKD